MFDSWTYSSKPLKLYEVILSTTCGMLKKCWVLFRVTGEVLVLFVSQDYLQSSVYLGNPSSSFDTAGTAYVHSWSLSESIEHWFDFASEVEQRSAADRTLPIPSVVFCRVCIASSNLCKKQTFPRKVSSNTIHSHSRTHGLCWPTLF